ncbi:MAG: site-2 protease family protein, partial [Acidimicrobiia bacterium]|nr:site-2 protease family protein [Acidimicrobiia bacterium]
MNISRLDIIFFAVLVPSVILHEISHGWVALAFGDDTAKKAGRLTLNPIAHIDPFGTIILPALLIATSHGAFGYAKPVPVNPRQLRDPRNQSLLVSLAGPAVNVALSVLAALVLRQIGLATDDLAHQIVYTVGWANAILAAFNLLPIPPLDGSAVVERLLPRSMWAGYLRFRQYSFGVLLIVVLFWRGGLSRFFLWALHLWA